MEKITKETKTEQWKKKETKIILCIKKEIGQIKMKEFKENIEKSGLEIRYNKEEIEIKGSVRNIEKYFDVKYRLMKIDNKEYKECEDTFKIPIIQEYIEGIVGKNDKQVAKTYNRKTKIGKINKQGKIDMVNGETSPSYYTPIQIGQLYKFPKTGTVKGKNIKLDGKGQVISIIELGGGYRQSDINTYFKYLGLEIPTVISVSVDGAKNSPSNANTADAEVALDIQIAGAIAPKATIVVYFAPNTEIGFYNGIKAAINNTKYNSKIISISWGAAEPTWSRSSLTAYNNLFNLARSKGINIYCASGDNGYTDGLGNKPHVDFPASSPHVISCGGTKVTGSTTITSETVWNNSSSSATGGGVSSIFPKPVYQKPFTIPVEPISRFVGRGVPDICAHADPTNGYLVYIDGDFYVVGGTSAVSPLWSGLTALLNQSFNTTLGFMNALLYNYCSHGKYCVNDILSGNNGFFSAHRSWDSCTGLGSPNGTKIYNTLHKLA